MSMFNMSYSPIYGTIVFDTESKALHFCYQMTLFFNRLSDLINVKLFIWITINTVILIH